MKTFHEYLKEKNKLEEGFWDKALLGTAITLGSMGGYAKTQSPEQEIANSISSYSIVNKKSIANTLKYDYINHFFFFSPTGYEGNNKKLNQLNQALNKKLSEKIENFSTKKYLEIVFDENKLEKLFIDVVENLKGYRNGNNYSIEYEGENFDIDTSEASKKFFRAFAVEENVGTKNQKYTHYSSMKEKIGNNSQEKILKHVTKNALQDELKKFDKDDRYKDWTDEMKQVHKNKIIQQIQQIEQ